MKTITEAFEGKESSLFKAYEKTLEVSPRTKYEYQDVGVEMEKYFGKPCWHFFKQFHYKKVEEAFKICKKKKNKSLGYLRGIIIRLK